SSRSCRITAQQGAQTGTTGLVEILRVISQHSDGAVHGADAAAVDVRVEVGDPQLDARTDADGRQTACADVPAQRGLAGVPPGSSLGDGDDGRTLAGSRHDGPLLSVRYENMVG